MKQTLILPFRFPDFNEYDYKARSHWSKGAAMKREYTEAVAFVAKAQKIKPVESVRITFTWIEKNRKRDQDNIAFTKKFILDGLQMAGILTNDGWKQVIYFRDVFRVDDEYEVRVELDDLKEI